MSIGLPPRSAVYFGNRSDREAFPNALSRAYDWAKNSGEEVGFFRNTASPSIYPDVVVSGADLEKAKANQDGTVQDLVILSRYTPKS